MRGAREGEGGAVATANDHREVFTTPHPHPLPTMRGAREQAVSRRIFAAGALALAATPFAAQAQQVRPYRLALVNAGRPVEDMMQTGHPYYRSFFQELRRLGHAEGENLSVARWSGAGIAESNYDDFARRIVDAAPDMIVSSGSRLVLAFKRTTTTIPIVMLTVADPVGWGLVERLNRPGGNVTGFASDAGADETGKRVQFLTDASPGLTTLAYLGTPSTWNGPGAGVLRDVAAQAGLTLIPALVSELATGESIRAALAGIPDRPHTGVVTSNGGDILTWRTELSRAALDLRLPVIGYTQDDARAGLLMSYAGRLEEVYALAAGYVDRIIKGASPGELPVQLPRQFDFVINLKTAKALGPAIPERLLVFATEVIE